MTSLETQAPQNAAKNPRYAWWIVAGGFLIMATCYTTFVNCLPLFQSAIVGSLQISVAEFNAGDSISTIVAVFASLMLGKLLDHHSARVLGSASVIICSVSLMLFASIQQLWQLYAICFIAGVAVLAGTRLLVSVLITNWFTGRRALALSIALAGSGVGAVILMPLCSALIQGTLIPGTDWRTALMIMGFICLIFALPLAVVTFRNHPSDLGLEPYGIEERKKADRSGEKPVTVAIGWKVLRHSWAFWLLVIGFVMMGIDNGAIIVNNNTVFTGVQIGTQYVTLGGHDAAWAANVLTFMMFVVIIGKVTLGSIYDRWGLNAGTLFGAIATFVSLICLCFPATDWGPIGQAIFFGFGTCLGTVAPPTMAVKAFGQKDIGMVTGVITAFEMFGAALGAVVSGLLFDSYHSYTPVWIFCMVCTAVMVIALMTSIPLSRRLVKRRIAEGAPQLDEFGQELEPA